ncbi:MAG: hypothetical protein Q9191_000953 [Dirinaria sp. TL-2023a]
MRAVLPGKPQARLQSLCAGLWEGHRVVAYISGNALSILTGPCTLVQTVYQDDCNAFESVVFSDSTGKIAACDTNSAYIYRPYGREEGALKWSLQSLYSISNEILGIPTLSWGQTNELLLGSLSLQLLQTIDDGSVIWNRKLPKPVKFAFFSPDASLIASTGYSDPLVKVWRRQSFGAEDTRFDFTYLPHAAAITGLHWRDCRDGEHALNSNVLYSICADKKIRVWAAVDPHGLQALQMCAEIDMLESIQPRLNQRLLRPDARYAFFLNNDDFRHLFDHIREQTVTEIRKEHHAVDHLSDIAQRKPEICVILDMNGHMSAWGVENVDCKARTSTNIFNIIHVDDLNLTILHDTDSYKEDLQLTAFCNQGSSPGIDLLIHCFDGRIQWVGIRPEKLFDPSYRQDCINEKALWSGHATAIKKIVRNTSGSALISRTSDNEGLVWKQQSNRRGTALIRTSALSSPKYIHRTVLLENGNIVINLHRESISLWDARSPLATLITSCDYKLEGNPMCLILLPQPKMNSKVVYLATISSRMKGVVWEVLVNSGLAQSSIGPRIEQFCTFEADIRDDLTSILPVDPAGSPLLASGFLDTFAKDVAVSFTDNGGLCTWTAALNIEKRTVEWLSTSLIETGIVRPSLASASSKRKSAVVDSSRTGLTIWDMSSGQLEHEMQYESEYIVQDLDWSSTPDDQSILAVGFPHTVIILAQMRFDYLSRGPAWAAVREIQIRESTPHPIGDSTWLGSGNLVVGAGNQLFLYDKEVTTSDKMITEFSLPVHEDKPMNLFKLVAFLNGPLPVFHPQFLGQCILAGKTIQVQKIIVGLYKTLRFFTSGDSLDSFVALSPQDFFEEQEMVFNLAAKEMGSSYAEFTSVDEPDTVTEELAKSLNENLAKLAIQQLSSHQQIHLADMIECFATAEKHRRSMDENAMRYLLFFRQHMLRKGQAPEGRVNISWREIVWAYHSGSQDILVDLVTRQFNGRMLWAHAKESGMFMWISDLTALKAQFEVIARNEYTKTDEKNPVDCSLYYLALRKKNVLIGLWRMASWNREQSATQRLLSNNFQDSRWKTAALKNAYALLGRHRFEYAAAFFLLADNLQAAVDVCANQLNDMQLAVAIARVYDGDTSPVLQSLLEDKVLPQAAFEGSPWLATWAFWMLGRRDMAVRALISPVYTLLDTPETPNLQSRSYLSSDPALVVLYKQLRDKTLQTLKGASKVSPRAEWDFVIQNARLYERMGCDLLALDLVRNWEFLRQQPREHSSPHKDEPPDPRKLLRRRSSLVVDDLPSPKSPMEKTFNFGKPPPKPVFEEPTTNSLLDNFGF